MTPQLPQSHQALNERMRDLREYGGSPCMKAWHDALAALEETYLQDLVGVSPEALHAKQSLVKQMRALRRIAIGEATTNGRV